MQSHAVSRRGRGRRRRRAGLGAAVLAGGAAALGAWLALRAPPSGDEAAAPGEDPRPATAAPADGPLSAASTTAPGIAPPTGWGPPVLLGTLSAHVTESSGLVASRRNPGLLWTHNDSGDEPLIYCLDLAAAGCGTWRVTGARARDWEDVAAGPGPVPGEDYLYLGDIGDNERGRTEVVVYRVPEPAVSPGAGAGQPTATAPSDGLRLRYPDGPHDAEALLVHPVSGDLYLVTKEPSGPAGVYRALAPLGAEATVPLVRVAELRLGRPGGPDSLVTGGDIAPDGRRVALCTYLDGYELALPPGDGAFDALWQRQPAPVPLAVRAQGEAIAYRRDGTALLTTSEGSDAPLHAVERAGGG